jgi:hypothetical protein
MTEHKERDEGASQTRHIMEEVKRRRIARDWSARRLADEMTQAGVPWNEDIVVNLEHGRRKSLRVHELLALAWVLDADSPVDLIVPDMPKLPMYAVTPAVLVARPAVRAWFRGETGPLRRALAEPSEGVSEEAAEMLDSLPPELVAQALIYMRSLQIGKAEEPS